MGAWCFSFTINTKMYLTYKIQSRETHIVLAGHFSSSVGIIGGYNGWNSIFPVLTHGLGSVEHREREAGAGSQAGLCSLYQLYRLVKLCHGFWDKRLLSWRVEIHRKVAKDCCSSTSQQTTESNIVIS